MKIGLISDTHLGSIEPPPQIARAFEGVDLILHAGDIFSAACLNWLERIAPVQAVEMYLGGYWDGDARVVERRVVELEGYAIGLVHDLALRGMTGEPFPGAIKAGFSSDGSLTRAVGDFFGKGVDIVVFGHTHMALVEVHQGVLLVNPGSATLPNHMRRLGTVAILELTPEGLDARLIELAGLS